ncbi:hypothetical protein Ahy_A05g025420 [Arachis hypogaea]|uniref:Endoplasmic reticulum vesicle transporter C-terminal domain-containing protein n=1 Tax=Arachis hypogaea TaxID=3818 RepID=A0A445D8N1_ARAHY|nr:hypothetical protein Ahy_A05g025420 [Arachis hypogaea]
MNTIFNRFRNLDAYPKVHKEFYNRTITGGVITVVSTIVICFLKGELCLIPNNTNTETKLLVDTSRGETLDINFDVTFPYVRCSLLSLDAMDITGEQHRNIRHNILKKRIDAHGNVVAMMQDGIGAPKIQMPLQIHGGRLGYDEEYCGSCYGADGNCCNSCEEVQEAYNKKEWALPENLDLFDQCQREGYVQRIKDEEGEGCNIHGSLQINKVAGDFHFAIGKSILNHSTSSFLVDLLALRDNNHFNISHQINKFSFGAQYPGLVNPLDDDDAKWVQGPVHGHGIYQYFIKVVPTIYEYVTGHVIYSNQYSVTEHFTNTTEQGSVPGVFFSYDISPIKVIFKESHTPLLHFLTNICAIIGGVFTVAGILDSSIYYGQRKIMKKVELGKYR